MAKILVHVTVGPNDPNRAALAFFVARAVIEEGHQLVLFVAGDGVHLLTSASAASVEGLGTGKLSDHFEAINASATAEIYFSGMSAKARNIAPDEIVLRSATPGMPNKLVQLIAESDKVISY
ncbi:putative peroxiredoxin [Sinorhizobium kostiense]|uniref:Peroxiredoxin n=1 Tax=Sinorhizobium kostiense TaxID=76747 RepID=A0ABS4QZ22_9HYPH|nr:DsrE family protein [Sinorhizobium kostiense]MBP2235275.1 putative peroxiredoxin [Sinorhizobium kostiense]